MAADDSTATGFDVLLTHLDARARAGESHVWLSPEARQIMREWHGGAPVRTGPGSPPPAERPLIPATPVLPPKPAPPAAEPVERLFARPAGSDREAALAAVRNEALACPRYAELRSRGVLRDTMVFASGNAHSPLVLIGEAPGADEEILGEPFVGKAGQLLTKILSAMGLQRSDVYITNIVKYRPHTGEVNQGTGNRKPTAEEISVGLPFVRRELEIIRPQVIVALGATALEALLGEPLSIGRARGRFHDLGGTPLMPTFHPSYLLHNDALSERRKVWEDLLQVMERLNMPISDRQRAFFKA